MTAHAIMSGVKHALIAALLAVPVAAQPSPARGERRPFDAVVAIIGENVVLRSTLDREVIARGGPTLDRDAYEALQQEIILDIAREEMWIQHGKSIGEQAPAEFERTIERLVDQRLKEEIRGSGSFSQFDEELGLLGTSWEDFRRRERNNILEQIARGNLMTQLQRSQGLMVTPTEMKDFYDEYIKLFVRESSADIAWVGFEVDPESDRDAAITRIREAGAVWQAEDLSSAEVAERFGGTDLGIKEAIRQDDDDTRAKFLKQFAATHDLGAVSEPLPRGERFFALLRVVGKHGAESRAFADPTVQKEIRQRIAIQRANLWQNQVLMRKQRKIYLWPPTLNLAR